MADPLQSVKRLLKGCLPGRAIDHLRWLSRRVSVYLHPGDLSRLALLFGPAKWNPQWYAQQYERYFRAVRRRRLRILEIGVGGYANPGEGGHSLRMWKAYFPNSRVYGIDFHDKRALEEDRIRIFQGDQSDTAFLRRTAGEIGELDIVIDDGSHINSHVISTFETLFPLLKPDGIYIVEDSQTSYWPGMGGRSDDLDDPTTIMGYFKRLADGVNYAERIAPGYTPSYLDKTVVAVHFYHNLIVVLKGMNDHGSYVIQENTTDKAWVLGHP